MTVEELIRFRQSRRIYLQKGMGAFNPEEWKRYQAALTAFNAWLEHEVPADNQDVVRLYFSRAMPDWAVALRTYYSERQIRRIRAKIYKTL